MHGITSENIDHQLFANTLRDLIQDLPFRAVSLLNNAWVLRKYSPGDFMIREGQPSNGVLLLITGQVQPALSHAGPQENRTIRLAKISAPALLGLASGVLGKASAVTISTLVGAEAAFIPKVELEKVLREIPQAGLAFSRLLAEELAGTYLLLSQLRSAPRLSISAHSI